MIINSNLETCDFILLQVRSQNVSLPVMMVHAFEHRLMTEGVTIGDRILAEIQVVLLLHGSQNVFVAC